MSVNVSNMPMNRLYKFGDNSYVWSVMLNETREGIYRNDESRKYTEVYRIDENGVLTRIASGSLVDKPSTNDYDKRFAIYDYDKNCVLSFFIEKPISEVNLDDLYKLRDSIPKDYKRNK